MRFAFIKTAKAPFPVALMCRVLQVSRSGYYAWSKRPPAPRTLRDQTLALEVAAIHAESRGRYGSPRVHAELRERPAHRAQARSAPDASRWFVRAGASPFPLYHRLRTRHGN